ncbi:MAG: VOC family protein [Motilibacteraceae bacterium]
MSGFLFWQLTIDANDPALLAWFWGRVLGWPSVPPAPADAPWYEHYRRRLGERAAFEDRLFDPEGLRPPIWFQQVPEGKAGKNRLHLDVYPTRRDPSLSLEERVALVDAKVEEVVALGARVLRRERDDDPEDPDYYVVLQDPEGNEFCVG